VGSRRKIETQYIGGNCGGEGVQLLVMNARGLNFLNELLFLDSNAVTNVHPYSIDARRRTPALIKHNGEAQKYRIRKGSIANVTQAYGV